MDGFRVHLLFTISRGKPKARQHEGRVLFKSVKSLSNLAVIVSSVIEIFRANCGRNWVEIQYQAHLPLRFGEAIAHGQDLTVPIVSGRVVGIQADGTLILALSSVKIPIVG